MNKFTKQFYQGKNAMIVALSGYTINEWAGYRQWKENGYQVKKGEKGTPIQIVFTKKDKTKGVSVKSIFNIEQVTPIKATA